MSGASQIEVSAGVALIRYGPAGPQLLLMRVRSSGFELPKGHVEADETLQQAAARELLEETGLLVAPPIGAEVEAVEYVITRAGTEHLKRVHYFLAVADAGAPFGPRPSRTRELRWVTATQLSEIEWVDERLAAVALRVFEMSRGLGQSSPP